MTERLADVTARLEGIRQLQSVVNAMKGIAAARAHAARSQSSVVDAYAATIAAAMAEALGPDAAPAPAPHPQAKALLVFGAEQGFAGAFTERILDQLAADPAPAELFLIGSRGLSVAESRGLAPAWTAALPSHTPAIPKLADRITRAVYASLDAGRIDALDVVHAEWVAGRPTIQRTTLFPIDRSLFPPASGARPILQLPQEALLWQLGADYLHALVCRAALHAFAAENEARLQTMTSAGSQISKELDLYQGILRRVRQESITAEIIELGAGAAQDRDRSAPTEP